MTTIIVKGPTEAIGEANARAPARDRAKSAIVGDKVTDVDALALRRELPDLVLSSTERRDHRLSQSY